MREGAMTWLVQRCLRGLLFFLVVESAGCTAALRQEFDQKLSEAEARENEKYRQLQGQLDRERFLRESDVRRVASRVECHNDKVRDFLKECESGSDLCSEKGLENAYRFMITQPYVTAYLRPRAGIKGLVATRKGQLATMGDPKNWLPSTRFLVLVQPRNESPEALEEALTAGREIQRYVMNHLFNEEKVAVLGPKSMPCKMKAEEVAKHVASSYDTPVKGEPAGHEPSIRVWVFKTDC